MKMLNNDFSRGIVGVEAESSAAIGSKAGSAAAEHGGWHAFARAVSLHGQVLAHRFGYAVAVLATLNAPLGNVLDLCSPDLKLAD